MLQYDVPRDIAAYRGYSRSYYGREMRVDYADAQFAGLFPGGITYPCSQDITRDPLTGAISLKPHYLYDWQSSFYSSNKSAFCMSLAEFNVGRAGLWSQINKTAADVPFLKLDFDYTLLPLTGVARLALVTLLALVGQVAAGASSYLGVTLRSKLNQRANQGWHFVISNFGERADVSDDYCAFQFGRFQLTLGTTGEAHLFAWPSANQTSSAPTLIDKFSFAKTLQTHGQDTFVSIIPLLGNLLIYISQIPVSNRNLPSHNQPASMTSRRVRVDARWDAASREWITVESAPIGIATHLTYRFCVSVQRVAYPTTGRLVTPAEQLPEPPPTGLVIAPPHSGFWRPSGSDYVSDEATYSYEPGDVDSGGPGTTAITYSYVDGDQSPGAGNTPQPFVPNGSRNHPRIMAVLARTSADLYVTPWHFGHEFRFEPSFIPDPRGMLNLYITPKEFTLTRNAQSERDRLKIQLRLARSSGMSALDAENAARQTLWTIAQKRPQTNVRLWWEAPGADRTQDILMFAGITSDEPFTITRLARDHAIVEFNCVPMIARMAELSTLNPTAMDSKRLMVALGELVRAAGFQVFETTDGTGKITGYTSASRFQVSTTIGASSAIEVTDTTIPADAIDPVTRYKPQVSGTTLAAALNLLRLAWKTGSEVELKWDTTAAVDSDNGGRRFEAFILRVRANAPRYVTAPTTKRLKIGPRLSTWVTGVDFEQSEALKIELVRPEANIFTAFGVASPESSIIYESVDQLNELSTALNPASLLDPSDADYVGWPIRAAFFDPSITTQEEANACAANMLAAAGRTVGSYEVAVPFDPTVNPGDYFIIYDVDNVTELARAFVHEVTVNPVGLNDRMRLVLRTRWESDWEAGG